jgi:hypothetical protein
MPALENPLKLRWGFQSIGEFIGRSERETEYLVKTGKLPAKKVGKMWCSSEPVLTEHLESQLRTCLPHLGVK